MKIPRMLIFNVNKDRPLHSLLRGNKFVGPFKGTSWLSVSKIL